MYSSDNYWMKQEVDRARGGNDRTTSHFYAEGTLCAAAASCLPWLWTKSQLCLYDSQSNRRHAETVKQSHTSADGCYVGHGDCVSFTRQVVMEKLMRGWSVLLWLHSSSCSDTRRWCLPCTGLLVGNQTGGKTQGFEHFKHYFLNREIG